MRTRDEIDREVLRRIAIERRPWFLEFLEAEREKKSIAEQEHADLVTPSYPIYRVVREIAVNGVDRPRELLYFGDDRQYARQAYHASAHDDGDMYGTCRRTVSEVISDAGDDDFGKDEVSTL